MAKPARLRPSSLMLTTLIDTLFLIKDHHFKRTCFEEDRPWSIAQT
jgi:hypothetical protein